MDYKTKDAINFELHVVSLTKCRAKSWSGALSIPRVALAASEFLARATLIGNASAASAETPDPKIEL